MSEADRGEVRRVNEGSGDLCCGIRKLFVCDAC